MPNQHAETRQAVTYRLPRELVTAVKARAVERGETVTEAVERLLREYADSPLMPVFMPPPAQP